MHFYFVIILLFTLAIFFDSLLFSDETDGMQNAIDPYGSANSSADSVLRDPQIPMKTTSSSFQEMSPPSPIRMEFVGQNKSSSATKSFLPMVPPFPLRMSRVQNSDILPQKANENFENVNENKKDCCLFGRWHTN